MTGYRGGIFHFLSEPDGILKAKGYEFFPDGLLLVKDGKIAGLGHAKDMLAHLSTDFPIEDYSGKLICPGFIDTHIHFPQTEMIASYSENLLEWLASYTYLTERKFSDLNYASGIAEFFLDELLRCGTTTAQVFGTVHPESVHAFFTAAQKRNLRMICGKVLMDRNAPSELLDTPEDSYLQSKELIEEWHGQKRLRYAVTPRFAPTSTPEQLGVAGQLLAEYPGVHLHTHLSEDIAEINWVKELFPKNRDYVDVYNNYNLLGKRSTFAHCVHMKPSEWDTLAATECAIAFCPSANLFLGSGLFDLGQAKKKKIKVSLGTDVGAGISFSMLQIIADAYKTQQLAGHNLNSLTAFYLATLGGARALDCDEHIGNFEAGKEADFIILDPASTPLMELRVSKTKSLQETLFVIAMLGDDRAIKATYAGGCCVHQRDATDKT